MLLWSLWNKKKHFTSVNVKSDFHAEFRERKTYQVNCSLCISSSVSSPKRIAGRILSSVNAVSELPRRVSVSSRLWPDSRGFAFASAEIAESTWGYVDSLALKIPGAKRRKKLSRFGTKVPRLDKYQLKMFRDTSYIFVWSFNLCKSLMGTITITLAPRNVSGFGGIFDEEHGKNSKKKIYDQYLSLLIN